MAADGGRRGAARWRGGWETAVAERGMVGGVGGGRHWHAGCRIGREGTWDAVDARFPGGRATFRRRVVDAGRTGRTGTSIVPDDTAAALQDAVNPVERRAEKSCRYAETGEDNRETEHEQTRPPDALPGLGLLSRRSDHYSEIRP